MVRGVVGSVGTVDMDLDVLQCTRIGGKDIIDMGCVSGMDSFTNFLNMLSCIVGGFLCMDLVKSPISMTSYDG